MWLVWISEPLKETENLNTLSFSKSYDKKLYPCYNKRLYLIYDPPPQLDSFYGYFIVVWSQLILPISFMIISQVLKQPALKTKCLQFDNIVITGGTVSCHNDNLLCHQWRQSCQIDYLFFSEWQ